jgi:lipopolysaccharide transport system ATP-binding protein
MCSPGDGRIDAARDYQKQRFKMTSVISVENLSKKYIIGHQKHERYTTLRDVLANGAKDIANKLRHPFAAHVNDPTHEEFWALKDVSFDIRQGDRVGIIGRNGAGKSSLLKILSRITEPTSGKVSIMGRVASLLEVGTGFHPELTGRENIFLNGAILGMNKAEIKNKFDEIVSFAEVERFLDTPVKRYSSGMYVRLAFAVAAHLEPEILIVDEVLAVGDAQFQKKCLGKMEEVGKEGRTILFVSHNMGAIQQLTDRCVLLTAGCIAYVGDVATAVDKYQTASDLNNTFESTDITSALEGFTITILFDKSKLETGFNKPIYFGVDLALEKKFESVSFGFGIVNSLGARIMTLERSIAELPAGEVSIEFELDNHYLPPGNYSLEVGFGAGHVQIAFKKDVLSFNLPEAGIDSTYLVGKGDRIGVFRQPEYRIQYQ